MNSTGVVMSGRTQIQNSTRESK